MMFYIQSPTPAPLAEKKFTMIGASTNLHSRGGHVNLFILKLSCIVLGSVDLGAFTDYKVVRYFKNDNSESISSAPLIVHFFMI